MHQHSTEPQKLKERKTQIVVALAGVTMLAEIGYGYYTNSMALLMDGWHMASHVLVLGLTWIAYHYARKHAENPKFRSGTGKLLSLSGFTSAILLLMVAFMMGIESVERIISPEDIKFKEAIIVAIVGLIVNGISAAVLHHKHEDRDHNIHAAYLHVLADGLTSILAIGALLVGLYWHILWLDAVSGVLAALIIIKWSVGLLRNSGAELVEYQLDHSHHDHGHSHEHEHTHDHDHKHDDAHDHNP